MVYLGLALLTVCLLCFLSLWLADSRGTWVVTPFLIFAAFEMISLWPSTISAYYTGLSSSAYPILVAGLGFASFLAGFAFFRWLPGGRVRSPKTFLSLPIQLPIPATNYIMGLALTTLILLGMAWYRFQGIPPVIYFLLGQLGLASPVTTGFVQTSREFLNKAHFFGGQYRGQGLTTSFMHTGWPFLLAICLSIYDKTRKKSWLLASILFFLFTFIFIAGEGTRSPFIFAMLYVLVVISMLKRLKTRFLVLIGVTLFAVTIVLSLSAGKIETNDPNSSLNYAIQRILTRIALDDGIDSVYVIEFVESGILDYRYGAVHWQKAILALPGPAGGLPFSRELSVLLHKKSATSFSSTTYLATLYIDFGLTGVMLGYLMIGCTIGLAQRILFSGKKTPLQLALVGYTTFYLGFMSLNGGIGFISSYVVVLAIYFIFVVGASLRPIFVIRRPTPGFNEA